MVSRETGEVEARKAASPAAAVDWDAVEWETAVPETGDQIVFDTIGDEFVGLYHGKREVPVTEKDGRETSFLILMFTGTDGKPYQTNAGWKLEAGFQGIEPQSIVRITYVKDVDTGHKANPMKDFRVEVARIPQP